MSKDEYLIADEPLKALNVFSMPMILGSFFQQVYNMARTEQKEGVPENCSGTPFTLCWIIGSGRSDPFASSVFADNLLDTFVGIQKIADGRIVVQGVDQIGNVFAHITVDVPFSGKKLRCLVD